MIDLRDVQYVQIQISADKKTVWINTENGCQLRIQNVKEVEIIK